jgi:xylose isomerase
VAYAVANGIFGSIDANRGDAQNGWDTDQFPNSVDELSLVLYEIMRGGGFSTGGFNFDTKLRRQSIERADLFHGHVGGIDTLARSLLVAEALIDGEVLSEPKADRYRGWTDDLGKGILGGAESLESLAAGVENGDINPAPVSGLQEVLENKVNRVIWNLGD